MAWFNRKKARWLVTNLEQYYANQTTRSTPSWLLPLTAILVIALLCDRNYFGTRWARLTDDKPNQEYRD